MKIESLDYRKMLQSEFELRRERNSAYTLRGFARNLGISPARLSSILNGRYGLSAASAQEIAKRMGLSPDESNLFKTLVESEHARSPLVRRAAKIRLEQLKPRQEVHELQIEVFKAISGWHHFAILELCLVEGFKSNEKWIAKTLGISALESKMAISRLIKLDLLQWKKKRLVPSDSHTSAPLLVPSDAKKNFHARLLNKAVQALFQQPFDMREFYSGIVAIHSDDIPEAKARIKEFREKFMRFVESKKVRTDVYCLGVQFFSIRE